MAIAVEIVPQQLIVNLNSVRYDLFNYSVPLLRRQQLNSAPVATPDSEGQQLVLEDEAEPGSDFYEFRAKLREEVQKRNAEFVEAVIPETGLALGFSVPRTRDNLNLDEPTARFWLLLEKAIAIGCAPEENPPPYNIDSGSQIWVCPNVAQAFARQVPVPTGEEGVSGNLIGWLWSGIM